MWRGGQFQRTANIFQEKVGSNFYNDIGIKQRVLIIIRDTRIFCRKGK